MTKLFFTTALTLLIFISQAQEIAPIKVDKRAFLILKTKLGISQLELLDQPFINGNVTQIDLLVSSRLSDKYRIEYGLGFSQFNGNHVSNGEYVYIKNNNFRLPINLMYNRDFNTNVSLIYGVGSYGTYYANTGIKGYYEGTYSGLAIGASVQLGVNFKISESLSFRILTEVQRDLSKISKSNSIEIRERMNALLGLNFVYRL
jgi:Outer membrane protein beta-barrel domain